MWANIKFLAGKDLRSSLLAMGLTAIFYIFIGGFLGSQTIEFSGLQEDRYVLMIREMTMDWVMLCMLLCLGFVFSKEYFHYHRTDSFSRRLAFYRKLPVTNKEIVLARYVVFFMNLLAMSLCFYVPFFLIARLGADLSPLNFLGAVMIWSSLSLVGGAIFLYMELGFMGKYYLRGTFIFMGIILVILVVVELLGVHLYSGGLYLAEHYNLWPGNLFLALGIIAVWVGAKKTVRRLDVRDLL